VTGPATRTAAAETARRATPSDLPEVVRLARLAAVELGPLRGGSLFLAGESRSEPIEPGLTAALDDPDQAIWLGALDGVAVGYAATRLERLADGRLLAVATDLFVEPLARAVGVGEALMTEILAWAKGLGAVGVDSWALPGARETKNFFEEQGFTARLLTMHHRFGARE
jgi:GNAT superfamily N-acetyltransferase